MKKSTKEKCETIESIIDFLIFNFYKENPDSFLGDEAFIEDGEIYNASYTKLVYCFENLRLEFLTSGGDTSEHLIYENRNFILRGVTKGDLVYSSRYEDGGNNVCHKFFYTEGEWEEKLFHERESRLIIN